MAANEILQSVPFSKIDTDPNKEVEATTSGNVVSSRSTKFAKGSAWSRLSRELSDDDLNQPGTKKMILEKLDTLSDENESLKSYQLRYNEIDKKYAVLQEKYTSIRISVQLIDIFSMTGTLLIGFIPWLYDHKVGIVILVLTFCVAAGLLYLPRRIVSSEKGGATK